MFIGPFYGKKGLIFGNSDPPLKKKNASNHLFAPGVQPVKSDFGVCV